MKNLFWPIQSRKLSPLKKNLKEIFKDSKNWGFFEKKKKIIIEIGQEWVKIFYLANKYPRRKVIGIEPFKNGLANIANVCVKNKIKNIYLFPHVFQKFVRNLEIIFLRMLYFFPRSMAKKNIQKED